MSAKPLSSSLRKGLEGFERGMVLDFARGVSMAVLSELSPTSDRTKNGLRSSESGLKGFPGLMGVDHRCHQCDKAILVG